MENLRDMFVMLAKLMSKEQCFERLQKTLDKYKEAILLSNDEEIKHAESEIIMSCHLLMLNTAEGKATDILKQMDEVKRSVDFFKTEKN